MRVRVRLLDPGDLKPWETLTLTLVRLDSKLKKAAVPGDYVLSDLLPGDGRLWIGPSTIPVALRGGETTFIELVRDTDGFHVR